jgi:hypothetical protein
LIQKAGEGKLINPRRLNLTINPYEKNQIERTKDTKYFDIMTTANKIELKRLRQDLQTAENLRYVFQMPYRSDASLAIEQQIYLIQPDEDLIRPGYSFTYHFFNN